MAADREQFVRGSIALVAGVSLLTAFSACSPRHSHIPPPQFLSMQEKAQVIRKLQAAKELDERHAVDPNVSGVTAADSAAQAAKADKAIRELTHGFEVSETNLANALQVPPTHLSPQRRADLIRQLKDAKALDDRREQELLNDYFSDQPVDTDKFDAQKKQVDEVVKDLEIGEDVHWSTIRAALKVPASPH